MRQLHHTSVVPDTVRGLVLWSSSVRFNLAHWWLMSDVEMESTSTLTPTSTWYVYFTIGISGFSYTVYLEKLMHICYAIKYLNPNQIA